MDSDDDYVFVNITDIPSSNDMEDGDTPANSTVPDQGNLMRSPQAPPLSFATNNVSTSRNLFTIEESRLLKDLPCQNPNYESRDPNDEALVVPVDSNAFSQILQESQNSESPMYFSSQGSIGSQYPGIGTESSHSLQVSSQESFSGMHYDSPAGSQPTSFASMPTQEHVPGYLLNHIAGSRDHEAPSSQNSY